MRCKKPGVDIYLSKNTHLFPFTYLTFCLIIRGKTIFSKGVMDVVKACDNKPGD